MASPPRQGEPAPASALVADGLEVPRPLRLLLTAGWSLTESVGLPAAAYVLAAWLDAGTGVSTWWFLSVLRRLGLRLRFAQSRM